MNIIPYPICFDAQRIALTRHYMQTHYGMRKKDITIIPKMIVLHWTEIPTLQESFDCLNPPILSNRPDIASHDVEVNVSAHFLVDRDGSIYQLMPESWMARHVIGLNHVAIGIENVGGVGSIDDLTDNQINANIQLVHYLCDEFKTIVYLIGHHEYGRFRQSALWLEKDNNYFTEKQDPGDRFMEAVRLDVESLDLGK